MTISDQHLETLARAVYEFLVREGLMIATAESCTGGWVAKLLTDIPGSSDCLGYGFVTYSNAAKQSQLGVPADLLERHGAVSEEAVCAMARGALAASGANLSLAISGVAGPTGGTGDKPVGTVWFAWGDATGEAARIRTRCVHFQGDRDQVRRQAVAAALEGVVQ